ncbi:hypothetical protein ABT160_20065 [Streptomyces sp. NPDC001941]|uniref:hypothetical protein n=1 Tax=Streptomyces sp. NPDC001941 TaxID=3154659 RepID=UPI00331F95E8
MIRSRIARGLLLALSLSAVLGLTGYATTTGSTGTSQAGSQPVATLDDIIWHGPGDN